MPASAARSIPNPYDGQDGGTVTVDASPEVRRGCYADIATVRTNGAVSTIDFALVEGPTDAQGNLAAVLTARVSMSNENLVQLRDLLNNHTQGWQRA